MVGKGISNLTEQPDGSLLASKQSFRAAFRSFDPLAPLRQRPLTTVGGAVVAGLIVGSPSVFTAVKKARSSLAGRLIKLGATRAVQIIAMRQLAKRAAAADKQLNPSAASA